MDMWYCKSKLNIVMLTYETEKLDCKQKDDQVLLWNAYCKQTSS